MQQLGTMERFVGEENWDCLDKESGIGYKCKERLEHHFDKVKSWSEGRKKLADQMDGVK